MPEHSSRSELLTWEQPRLLAGDFSLSHGGSTLGSLIFRSNWGTLATGTLGTTEWTFKRQGFLRTTISVRAASAESALATFQPSAWNGGGTLTLADGRQFRVDISFWQTRLDILGPNGAVLLQYRPRGVFRQGADMEVFGSIAALGDLSWLMLFGWYLAVLLHRDAAASASVTG
jgi:hypothetical protein